MSTNRQFFMGSAIWHEIYEQTRSVIMEDKLNQHISLQNYGSGVNSIYFTHIVMRPANKNHPDFQRYKPRKKEIHFGINLVYEEVKGSTNTEVLRLMGQSFLNSILLYPELKVKDFDYKRFYTDVQKLFAVNGWLMSERQVA